MLKSFYPKIQWKDVKAVGFDLDGTLYDEIDFILQVYEPISWLLAKKCFADQKDIYSWMVRRWLEKGSSYPYIFEEVMVSWEMDNDLRQNTIAECLEIFRLFKPKLYLTIRTKFLLDVFFEHFELFLITDGSTHLQRAKIQALGLERWVKKENIGISGTYGKVYEKPATLITQKVGLLSVGIQPQEIVFFGDRNVDREFAANAGFQFMKVRLLYAEEKE